ncbi:MAG: (2Fe-2S)-binding protein [Magnetococcales bacterium]|nr:(2Fe-2S)-binding protein [Magnetococcales bacterium]
MYLWDFALIVLVSESILESANRHGIALPYSCMSGRCGTCTCKCKVGVSKNGLFGAVSLPGIWASLTLL